MLNVGDKAPTFNLPTNGGGKVSLSKQKGKWVVIYFYPKDLTSGCTKQAIEFTERLKEFEDRGAVVIGISPDSPESHDKFVAKHDLKIILAADETKKVIESYDVWKEKKMYGNTYMGVERSTFLVDRNGIINEIWRKVRVTDHAKKILRHLDQEISSTD